MPHWNPPLFPFSLILWLLFLFSIFTFLFQTTGKTPGRRSGKKQTEVTIFKILASSAHRGMLVVPESLWCGITC